MKSGRIIRRTLLVLLAVYLIWIGWRGLSFRRYSGTLDQPGAPTSVPNVSTVPTPSPASASPSAPASGGPSPTPTVLPPVFELEGVYHLHSRFSDGHRTMDEIASVAAEAGLDFVVVTDHGAPNRGSLAGVSRRHGVLVLAGTEISSNRGHLVALGFDAPAQDFSRLAENAAAQVAAAGGFTVIAHPYAKTAWSWGPWAGYAGLEIFNSDVAAKRAPLRTLLFAPLLLARPDAGLTALVGPPRRETAAWDRWGAERPVRGYFASDAHFAYRALLRLFHTHALLDAPEAEDFAAARRQIFEALGSGRFYSAIEAAAEADGFRYWAEQSGRITPMGGVIDRLDPAGAAVRLTVRTPFAFAHEARLLRNGAPVASGTGSELVYEADAPGSYRVEVYLRERTALRAGIPWILSNPIFIGKGKS